MTSGSCLCGALSYRIVNAPTDCNNCYCSICRKLTGSVAGAYGAVLRADFTWLDGEELIKTFSHNASSHRVFCSNCGSCVLSHHDLAPDYFYLSLGCLDSDAGIKIEYQQFTGSKAQWAKLDPTLDQCENYPSWVFEKFSKRTK